MSRIFSFRDLKRIEKFASLREVDMLSIEYDDSINEALGQLGFDTRAPILYVPSLHRDLAGKVEVGYRAVGEINNDPSYLNSKLCPIIERLIWAARKDPSLARELSKMMGHSVNLDDDAAEESKDFPDVDVSENYADIQAQIELLTEIRDSIRGNPYNEFGNLKTPAEYKTNEASKN